MKRSFKPTLENLESRQMMDAAGMHAICENLAVAPMARTCEIAVVTEDASAIAFVGGWGASSYQYAFEGTSSHTAHDDVIVDGRIITGENYDSRDAVPTDQFSLNFTEIKFESHVAGGGAGKVSYSDLHFTPLDAPSDLVTGDESRIAAFDYFLKLEGVEGESASAAAMPEHEVGHWMGLYHGTSLEKSKPDGLLGSSEDGDTQEICHGVTVLAWARVDGVSPGWGSSMYQYAHTDPAL